MRLLLRRNQRAGSFSGTVIFCLDARAEFTPQEKQNIQRYRLGGQVIYNSEASKRALAKSEAAGDGSFKGNFKSLAYAALAHMKLNITIDGLERGQHVECKSLDELLGAEEAVMTACENLRGYLDTAATFDGREVVVEYAGGQPVVVAQAAALGPPAAAPPPQPPRLLPAAAAQYELHDGDAAPVASSAIRGVGGNRRATAADDDEIMKYVLGSIALIVAIAIILAVLSIRPGT